jgi:hypothetical protein
LELQNQERKRKKMNDPTIYSDLSAVILVIGGILLVLGVRWLMFKRTEGKFVYPIMACAFAELAIGSILIAIG